MKNTLIELFCTKIGLLVISMIGVVFFGFLTNWFDWAKYPMFVFLVYPVGLSLVMIAFAWVINPLRRYRERNKGL